MRILHTADWHIGKIVNEFSMLEDQKAVLHALVDKVKELEVDVLIMAGDLYDRAIPPKEAVTLANSIFNRLIKEAGIPVLVIAGNHDSNERLEYGAELLAGSQLFIEGTVKKDVRKVTIDNVNFYLLPFADHVTIRQLFEDKEIRDLKDATRKQVESITSEMNLDEVNVLIAHGYIVNGVKESVEASDSERPLSIGTAEYVDVNIFDDFDYVALGHLHKAQKVKSENVRYSGSPLKYSKSEVRHKKQFALLDIDKDTFNVEMIEIKTERDMKVLKGTFNELMADESEDYIFFELEDNNYVMDAMNQLRRRYPYAMGLEYTAQKERKESSKKTKQEALEKKGLLELFDDFYSEYKQTSLDSNQKKAINKTWEDALKGEK
ncbi:MAG: exonuclease SbcCD subunit D [Lactococcus lactis]|uniref:exonuclease SbcCD subunit D n=1 Tax=Alkalibacterium sp. TaxID=1872447 RepID=UPI002649FCC0|nr:exonuclease SbcCD subunit D [Alkalibacterium sp.]MDN6293337.1 exonuclease SbcCD subunit D [Alkalibacterium sp.]MDN6295584.1 exonuclease SbcCD subunit D [Alkalibacterium sp.]MDN6342490.1 exonuclease SbcCD subunit D [Lactococcus lactis]MDN6734348.1 exonuclease SbcCD subunit D [Tetragenococcus koreensis]